MIQGLSLNESLRVLRMSASRFFNPTIAGIWYATEYDPKGQEFY